MVHLGEFFVRSGSPILDAHQAIMAKGFRRSQARGLQEKSNTAVVRIMRDRSIRHINPLILHC
jgi:hypothetical protein